MNQAAPSVRQLMKRAQSAMQKESGGLALEILQQVLTINPHHVEALYNMGYILHCVGRLDEGQEFYQRCIQMDPHYINSYLMLGKLLEERNQGDQAIRIAHLAAQMAPDNPKTHHDLVGLLIRFNHGHLAMEYIEQILPKFPKNPDLLQVYCMALKMNDRYEEADIAYDRLTKELHVGFAARVLYETYLPRLYRSAEQIDKVRERFKAALNEFIKRKVPVNIDQIKFQPIFQLAFHNRDNKELTQLWVKTLRTMAPVLNYTAPHCKAALVKPEGKIKVGYISRHMHNHSVGTCYRSAMISLAQNTDFSVILFNPDNVVDDKTQEIIDAGIPVITLPKAVATCHEMISRHKLDIIIYPDIGMDAMTHYLAMARMAPYQICLNGHPETTGIDTIDYFVSSRIYEPPDAQKNYTERLLVNPGVDTIFKRPETSGFWLTREQMGLPEGKNLYVCPMAIQKFHPDFDGVLADILAADPQAVIVLFNDFQQASASTLLRERILSKCDKDRVIFMPWLTMIEALFSVMKLADAILDTLYFGGGTTSQFAFHFGIPIVTMPNHYTRGRVVNAYYNVMGIEDAPIAKNIEEYVAMAVKLANDKDYAHALSEKILANNSKLFEGASFEPQFAQLIHDIIDQKLDAYTMDPTAAPAA